MNSSTPLSESLPDPLSTPFPNAELGGDLGLTPHPLVLDDALSPLRSLVIHLRSAAAGRSRVGFLSHPPQYQTDWRDMAARLGCEVAFLPQIWLDRLPRGATFASLSVAGLLAALDELAQNAGEFDVVLVAGLDLLLTRFDPDDCSRFWADLHVRFPHRPRALILALPHTFDRFGPDASKWEKVSARLD